MDKKGMDSRRNSKDKCKGGKVKTTKETINISTASRTNMIRIYINMIHSIQTHDNNSHIHPQARKVHNQLLILHLHS